MHAFAAAASISAQSNIATIFNKITPVRPNLFHLTTFAARDCMCTARQPGVSVCIYASMWLSVVARRRRCLGGLLVVVATKCTHARASARAHIAQKNMHLFKSKCVCPLLRSVLEERRTHCAERSHILRTDVRARCVLAVTCVADDKYLCTFYHTHTATD